MDMQTSRQLLKIKTLDRWENEGGALAADRVERNKCRSPPQHTFAEYRAGAAGGSIASEPPSGTERPGEREF